MRFKDRVAIVTGSAGAGIGSACIRAFAAEGASVVVSDPHERRTMQLTDDVAREYGVKSLGVVCDVSNLEHVNAMVAKTMDEFGRIDILVNNAGREVLAMTKDLSDEQWRLVVSVCLEGTFYCTRAVLPHMIEQKYGRLIHISSVAGFMGMDDGQSHYCAAKAGIMAFSRCVAAENAQYNITSNVIAPGLIMNEFLRKIYPEEFFRKAEKACPRGRAGTPDDVANGVLFLAQENSDFITGDIMNISGGVYYHH